MPYFEMFRKRTWCLTPCRILFLLHLPIIPLFTSAVLLSPPSSRPSVHSPCSTQTNSCCRQSRRNFGRSELGSPFKSPPSRTRVLWLDSACISLRRLSLRIQFLPQLRFGNLGMCQRHTKFTNDLNGCLISGKWPACLGLCSRKCSKILPLLLGGVYFWVMIWN